MPIITIENENHWHELRKDHIGGSEIQALLIENDKLELSSDDSFVTANELYFRKRGIISGNGASKIMEFGNVMEPIIAHMIGAEHGFEVKKCSEYHIHPDYPHLGCTLDYYAIETPEGTIPMQIKNVVHTSHKWSQVKGTPYVELQVIHELFVVNAARKAEGLEPFPAHCIASMHKGNPEDIRLMYRPSNPVIEDAIVEASTKFWQDMQQGIEPDINNPKDYNHILEMVKKAEKLEKVIDLMGNDDAERTAQEYLAAKERRKRAEKEEDLLKAKLMRYCMSIDDCNVYAHTFASLNNHVLSIKTTDINYKPRAGYIGKMTKFDVKEKGYA